MFQFVLRRLLAVLPVLLVVSLVVFLILRLAPGDPAAVIAGNSATNEDINRIREQLGLDRSILSQYFIWIGRVFQGDLGYSYYLSKPVTELIAQRIEPTLSLAAGTLVLAIAMAIPLGTIAAWRMGGWLDKILSGFSVAGFSVPVFVIGYLLIYLFAIRLEWLPVQGYKTLFGPRSVGVWDWMRQLILPWMTLAMIYVALIARVTRASVSEALTEDYIRTARAKGVGERVVFFKHTLRAVLAPLITLAGLDFAGLIGGAIITETIFNLPGLGRLTLRSVYEFDLAVVLATTILAAVVVIVMNLIVDMLYAVLDPRVRIV